MHPNCSRPQGAADRARRRRGRDVDRRVRDRHHRGRRVRRDPLQRGDRRLDRRRADQHHQPRAQHQRVAGDAGFSSTVEAALAIAALVVVVVLLCLRPVSPRCRCRCVASMRPARPRDWPRAATPVRRNRRPRRGAAGRIGGACGATADSWWPGSAAARRCCPGVLITAEAVAAVEARSVKEWCRNGFGRCPDNCRGGGRGGRRAHRRRGGGTPSRPVAADLAPLAAAAGCLPVPRRPAPSHRGQHRVGASLRDCRIESLDVVLTVGRGDRAWPATTHTRRHAQARSISGRRRRPPGRSRPVRRRWAVAG